MSTTSDIPPMLPDDWKPPYFFPAELLIQLKEEVPDEPWLHQALDAGDIRAYVYLLAARHKLTAYGSPFLDVLVDALEGQVISFALAQMADLPESYPEGDLAPVIGRYLLDSPRRPSSELLTQLWECFPEGDRAAMDWNRRTAAVHRHMRRRPPQA
jgi:hypothetical protein